MDPGRNETQRITIISAIGNPILDITSKVDATILEMYNLEYGKTVYINRENEGFFDFLATQSDVFYSPGGSVTNSIRVANVNL